jgi:hypothetical protein
MLTEDLAQKYIEEYKKFVFLGTCNRRALTPSDEIDQVWVFLIIIILFLLSIIIKHNFLAFTSRIYSTL